MSNNYNASHIIWKIKYQTMYFQFYLRGFNQYTDALDFTIKPKKKNEGLGLRFKVHTMVF